LKPTIFFSDKYPINRHGKQAWIDIREELCAWLIVKGCSLKTPNRHEQMQAFRRIVKEWLSDFCVCYEVEGTYVNIHIWLKDNGEVEHAALCLATSTSINKDHPYIVFHSKYESESKFWENQSLLKDKPTSD